MSLIDTRLVPEAPEESTPGAAVAGLSLTGLGCAHRPLSLLPQLFAHKPLERRLRAGGEAARCKRFKRGRPLAAVQASGGDRWCSARAWAVGAQAGLAQRCQHRDTPRVARRGDSGPARAEPAMRLTPGSAQDPRPDVPPAVVALLVSPAGGGPLVSTRWDGQTAARRLVQARALALMRALARSPTPRYRVAAAQRYTEATAAPRARLGLSTRMPGPLPRGSPVIRPALPRDTGPACADTPGSQGRAWGHSGLAQRGLVVSSPAALQRAAVSRTTAPPRAGEPLEPPRLPWHAKRCETPAAAQAARAVLAQAWRDQQVETAGVVAPQRDAGHGRPPPRSPLTAMAWPRHAPVRPEQARRAWRQPPGAGVVSGTPIDASHVSAAPVVQADTAPAPADGGCRLLTDPWLCVSSLFVKTPGRIPGLLRVMTVAVLVSAVTPRRWRRPWSRQHDTIPKPIHQPTARPPVRWGLQLRAGSHRGRVPGPGTVHDLMEGRNEVQPSVLRLCGQEVCQLYHIAPG